MDQYLWIGGVVIVGLVVLQVLWLAFDTIRGIAHGHAQRKLEAQLLQQRVAAAGKQRLAEEQKSAAWAGWRKFTVARKQLEDPDKQVCSFYLEAHDGKPIAPFEPGQFLTFQLNVPGQSKPLVRCYSLSDGPRPDHYRVSIKRVPAPRNVPDAPPGMASNFFHDQINEGDLLDVKAPGGHFYLDTANDRPVVLIGGGVGITPVLSMLNTITASGGNRETWFFLGVRHSGEHPLKEHLENIARDHPNVHLQICYSNPKDSDQAEVDYQHAERVSVDLFKRLLPSCNYDFYMCGPPPMMDSLVEDLAAWGVPSEKVHLEKFGPGAGRKVKKPVDPEATGPEVVFKKSGKSVRWDRNAEHLWEFAAANEVRIDSGCLEGNCGTCLTAILSGEVEYTKQIGFECEERTCLVCCCVPKGPLELDT